MVSTDISISQDAFKVRPSRYATLAMQLILLKGVCGTLFASAIIAAIARTFIRVRTAAKFAFDDALLLFACVCLIASTGLLYRLIPNAYLYERLDLGQNVTLPFPISDINKQTVLTVRILGAYTLLSWLVVFAVKFCFLFFFRALIDRLPRMIIYWRFVVAITIIFGGVALCETYIACPRIDASSSKSLRYIETTSILWISRNMFARFGLHANFDQ